MSTREKRPGTQINNSSFHGVTKQNLSCISSEVKRKRQIKSTFVVKSEAISHNSGAHFISTAGRQHRHATFQSSQKLKISIFCNFIEK